MNTETGEIRHFKEGEKIPKEFIQIYKDEMTELQKKNMQVSKFDNKSKLGKLYTSHRKLSRTHKNRLKRKMEATNV